MSETIRIAWNCAKHIALEPGEPEESGEPEIVTIEIHSQSDRACLTLKEAARIGVILTLLADPEECLRVHEEVLRTPEGQQIMRRAIAVAQAKANRDRAAAETVNAKPIPDDTVSTDSPKTFSLMGYETTPTIRGRK